MEFAGEAERFEVKLADSLRILREFFSPFRRTAEQQTVELIETRNRCRGAFSKRCLARVHYVNRRGRMNIQPSYARR